MTALQPTTKPTAARAHHKRSRRWNRLRYFVNHQAIAHEVLVIAVSYAFIAAGAWNDGILGFAPSPLSRACEFLMAVILGLEILTRAAFIKDRSPTFWTLLLLDSVSILTIVPQISYLSFLRLGRLVYASIRLTALLDRLSCRAHNPVYLVGLYPLVVPLLAAVVFAIEKRTPGSAIHTYIDALTICLTFSLSLGNVRPTSPWAMAICGALFLAGLLLIGICTNAISARYADDNHR
jgi:hypothetical protein